MSLVSLYKNKKYGTPLVIIIFVITCMIVTIPTYFDAKLCYLFATWKIPKFFWQYFSGTFEHAVYNLWTGEFAPWFIWIHFGTNLSIILLFGLIIEKTIGSNKMCLISFVAMITNVIIMRIYYISNDTITNQASVGASGVVYSYVPIGLYIIWKTLKLNRQNIFKQILIYIYIIEVIFIYIVITITSSWEGTNVWHLIATITGIIFLLIYRKIINKELEGIREQNNVQNIKKSRLLWLLWLIPLFMFTILLIYKFGLLG